MTTRPCLLAALMLLVSLSLPAHAEQTITVSALGETEVMPDTLVLTGEIRETNEKMKDAVTGFNDTRRRAMAAIKELGIENLAVSTSALSLEIAGDPQANPFGGQQPDAAPPGALVISQTVTLTVTGIDKLEEQAVIDLAVKLMEGVKETGVRLASLGEEAMMMIQMGMGGASGGAVVFKISDPKAAHKAATKAAIEKARADAAYLAELAGGKLGPVVRISDGPATAGEDESAMNPYMLIFGAMMGQDSDASSSTAYQAITVARPLSVSFQLITE